MQPLQTGHALEQSLEIVQLKTSILVRFLKGIVQMQLFQRSKVGQNPTVFRCIEIQVIVVQNELHDTLILVKGFANYAPDVVLAQINHLQLPQSRPEAKDVTVKVLNLVPYKDQNLRLLWQCSQL